LRLKKLYSSREVAALTGLSARQLQWWHERRFFVPSVAPHKTEAGGYTERRYTPVELLELMVVADLRRRRFSLAMIRRLMETLRSRFNVRLFEAIEGGGPVTLFIEGRHIYARTESGEIYNVLQNATQPLLMLGDDIKLKQLVAREGTRGSRRPTSSAGSGKSFRGRRPDEG
jgi:DNA-binding transcriptional MerR regulator